MRCRIHSSKLPQSPPVSASRKDDFQPGKAARSLMNCAMLRSPFWHLIR